MGKESLKTFARARFPALKPRAVGKPKKATGKVSSVDATLGRLEKSPPPSQTRYKSTRKAGSVPSSFSVFDWEREEALLRLEQEEKELRDACLDQSMVDGVSEDRGAVSPQRDLSPAVDDERMDTSPDPDIQPSPNDVIESIPLEAHPLSNTTLLECTAEQVTSAKPVKRKKVPTGPSERQTREYREWELLLPSLVGPYQQFQKVEEQDVSPSMLGVRLLDSECDGRCISKQETRVLCLFLECFKHIRVHSCQCQTVHQVLVASGLFPTSPQLVRTAISTVLLQFFRSLSQKSADGVYALSNALRLHYKSRGFILQNGGGAGLKDCFRRTLTSAIQWFDSLCVSIDTNIDTAILRAWEEAELMHVSSKTDSNHVMEHTVTPSEAKSTPAVSFISPSSGFLPHPNPPQGNLCAKRLQELCPLCFGGNTFGRSFALGGDIHVGVDGNMHHKRSALVGSTPEFYHPLFFVDKTFVDQVDAHLQRARGQGARAAATQLPQEVVNACTDSYKAARGDDIKVQSPDFAERGLFAMVCRHDIPLMLCNIDTPGEQQKYVFAFIFILFGLLPAIANVVLFYDIACIVDNSRTIYDILPSWINHRLQMATTAMHAYGHQWSCQLVFNPRFRTGVGLSNLEGVERFWSRMRRLIVLTRHTSAEKRIWIIDRQTCAIAQELRHDLADWLLRAHRTNIQRHQDAAMTDIEECKSHTVQQLWEGWEDQKATLKSVRAYTVKQIQREIEATFRTHSRMLEAADAAVAAFNAHVTGRGDSSRELLQLMDDARQSFEEQANNLYCALDLHGGFPPLAQIPLEYLRALLLAHHLKIMIRRKVFGYSIAVSRIGAAKGGKQAAAGTKIISRILTTLRGREPAIKRLVVRFNSCVDTLHELHSEEYEQHVKIPSHLPTNMTALQAGVDELQLDVWPNPDSPPAPEYITNPTVQKAINGVLRVQRCNEEELRLQLEARNLLHWLRGYRAALLIAFGQPYNSQYAAQLKDRLTDLDNLSKVWAQTLAKVPLVLPQALEEFKAAEQEARQIANDVLSLPTHNVDEQLARMDFMMETLAGRLARLRRIVLPQAADSGEWEDGESTHVGVIDGNEFSSVDDDEEDDDDIDEKLMVDILVADMLHDNNGEDIADEELDSL